MPSVRKLLSLMLASAILFLPSLGYCGIAFDAEYDGSGLGSSLTYSHTVTLGDDSSYLIVGAQVSNTGDVVTGITFNGVDMTRIGSYQLGSTYTLYLYGLANPDSGAHNVVISSSVGFVTINGVSASYNGVSIDQPDDTTQSTVSDTSITSTETPTDDACWLVGAFMGEGPSTLAAGTNTTDRGGRTSLRIMDNNADIVGGTSTSIQATVGISAQLAVISFTLRPQHTATSGGGAGSSFDIY